MTLLVRDEADILDQQLRFHLEHGVDFVVATDHRSEDGTTDILRQYERSGHLHLIREQAEALEQSDWVTRMARLAASEFGADWVVNSDADEFWWSREGPLREVLAAVPSRFGAIRGLWRHFVLRPDGDVPFFERMVVRRFPETGFTSPYHAQVKLLHRADPHVEVKQGNHDVVGRGLVLIRDWCPVEVLHFPIRSREQMERKYLNAWHVERQGSDVRIPRHIAAIATALDATSADDVYRALLVDDHALATGLATGHLAIDTRLRDVLRLARGASEAVPPPPSLEDDVALAAEFDVLQEVDAAVRLFQRVDAFEQRLGVVRASSVVAPGRALRRAVDAFGRRDSAARLR